MRGYHRSMRLNDVTPAYLQWRRSFRAANTVRNDKSALRLFTGVVGNIELTDLDHRHLLRFFDSIAETRQNSSSNQLRASLQAFFAWCRMEKLMTPDQDPLAGAPPKKVAKKNRATIPVHDFPVYLDMTTEPRVRALSAIGLYLFLRAGEITSLRVRDLDLQAGTIAVTIHKTGDADIMPISRELDRELRRWILAYEAECGPLQPGWFLVPARIQAGWGEHKLNPGAPISRPQEIIRSSLDAYGINQRWEAIHCLRRSGARALFDHLSAQGIDGALEIVSATLHHSSVVMTERYLQITHSRAKRDLLLKGQDMFPSQAAANVIPIKRAM